MATPAASDNLESETDILASKTSEEAFAAIDLQQKEVDNYLQSQFPFLADSLSKDTSSPVSSNKTAVLSRLLEVQGTGIINIPTDYTEVSLTIETRKELPPLPNDNNGMNPLDLDKLTKQGVIVSLNDTEAAKFLSWVSQESSKRSKRFVNYLNNNYQLDHDIMNLHTSNVNIQPTTVWVSNTRLLRGYVSTIQFTFRALNKYAGKILDDSIDYGVNMINRVSYVPSEKVMLRGRLMAVRKAVKDAYNQAKLVIQTSNSLAGVVKSMSKDSSDSNKDETQLAIDGSRILLKTANVISLTSPVAEDGGSYNNNMMADTGGIMMAARPEASTFRKNFGSLYTPILSDVKSVTAVVNCKFLW